MNAISTSIAYWSGIYVDSTPNRRAVPVGQTYRHITTQFNSSSVSLWPRHSATFDNKSRLLGDYEYYPPQRLPSAVNYVEITPDIGDFDDI